ncbi:50S ribosomal protein L13 [Candidatus Nomurabacteria bacterium RIFCSPLOWO2_01_FULL_46_18]|uniref:50S ribosomal protein L13 n=1 Tax=Candidatus Nomurabacteria bacterium RIFCSPLOWO2_01_FULL_46_18 TaxID=1801783 RepID=A0A1F6XDT0_9BACT|nr:MAG: 50S ribosomal protein L13 [Candidatus Nomurabacteria bacterium RIFCSPLOWO2_01_FULL_46_18]
MNEKELKTIDASGRTLGRIASEVAVSLMGKNDAKFERHVYSGFPVKVVNASKIRITSRKLTEIKHKRYSGSPGGLRVISAKETVEKKGYPELLRLAIYHMLPGNKLRREMMKNLKIEK